MIDKAQPFETEMIGKVEAVIYHTILTYNLKRHPNCGHKGQIVKNGTKTTWILLPNNNPLVSHLDLKKQQFLCKKCRTTTSATTNMVKRSCWIGKDVQHSVNLEAMRNSSLKKLPSGMGFHQLVFNG